ncbi:MAG: pilin [Candidatus Paceibacteria bacterium]
MTKHCGHTIWWGISGWLGLVAILFLFWPELALAQTFRSIVDIPGITDNPDSTGNFGLYINALYIFAITVGAMLAVLKLVAAGVKYMFSDIVTNKEAAKSDIKGALLGLLIVIGAVVILNTVNTDLTEVDLNFEPVDVDTRDYLGEELRRIQDLVASCTGPECHVVDCSAMGTFVGTCQQWCTNQTTRGASRSHFIEGGFFRAAGGQQYAARCLIWGGERTCRANGDTWNPTTQSCTTRGEDREIIDIRCVEDRTGGMEGYTYDCTEARIDCTGRGGEVLSGPNATLIRCALPTTPTPPPEPTIAP